jgi:hypothetical protein
MFDSNYRAKMNAQRAKHEPNAPLVEDLFSLPSYFSNDLFELLADFPIPNNDLDSYNDGTEARSAADPFAPRNMRPAHTWILCGSKRTGSTFHKVSQQSINIVESKQSQPINRHKRLRKGRMCAAFLLRQYLMQ